jgi:hypothetical protein
METPAIHIVSFLLLMELAACGDRVANKKDKSEFEYVVNNSFAFDLPMKADTAETLLALARKINPYILFLRHLNFIAR